MLAVPWAGNRVPSHRRGGRDSPQGRLADVQLPLKRNGQGGGETGGPTPGAAPAGRGAGAGTAERELDVRLYWRACALIVGSRDNRCTRTSKTPSHFTEMSPQLPQQVCLGMDAKLNVGFLAICGFGFACSAFAQIDGARFANDLRAKYGPPLARETFAARPGIEMVVDYAFNGHVCRIQLPPIGPGPEPGVKTGQAVDDFLAQLVPFSLRGKELSRHHMAMGAPSESSVEYENVTISETFQARRRTGVTVTFPQEECREGPVR